MKKSEAINQLQKFCKDWENSKLDEKFAKKLLFFIENGLEMAAPVNRKLDYPTIAAGEGHEWEKE